MRKVIEHNLGKILFAFVVLLYASVYYFDELEPGAAACKTQGGKKLYGECWVPLRNAGR